MSRWIGDQLNGNLIKLMDATILQWQNSSIWYQIIDAWCLMPDVMTANKNEREKIAFVCGSDPALCDYYWMSVVVVRLFVVGYWLVWGSKRGVKKGLKTAENRQKG